MMEYYELRVLNHKLDSYFVNVAQTKSAGNVAGKDRACNSLAPRWRNIQLARPLLADSMYVWNTVNTVSGMSPMSASCEAKQQNDKYCKCTANSN